MAIINSMKDRNAIFRNPMQLPTPKTFDLVGEDEIGPHRQREDLQLGVGRRQIGLGDPPLRLEQAGHSRHPE